MRRWPWILWLLIALMPVRGIAQSLMSFAPAPADVAVAATSPADAVPCPMHAIGAVAGDAMAPASGGNGMSHACSLCNVCHSAMLPLTLALSPASAMPDDDPMPTHGLGAGRAASAELFRPPR